MTEEEFHEVQAEVARQNREVYIPNAPVEYASQRMFATDNPDQLLVIDEATGSVSTLYRVGDCEDENCPCQS